MMNIEKKYISIDDSELLYGVWEIYQHSFPPSEKRTLTNLRDVMQGEHCRVVVYHDMGKVVGFIIFWDYPDFVYVEFFATNPTMRNSGMGAYIIRDFVADQTKTVILEIDEMCDEISKRRYGFYLREGFVLGKFEHTPTAYNDKNKKIMMHIMTYGKEISEQEYESFNTILVDEIMSNMY